MTQTMEPPTTSGSKTRQRPEKEQTDTNRGTDERMNKSRARVELIDDPEDFGSVAIFKRCSCLSSFQCYVLTQFTRTMCKKFKFQHHDFDSILYFRELAPKGKDEEVPVMEKDILAVSTDYLKTCLNFISIVYEKIRNTKCYRVLTTTTQPAHVAVMVAALLVAASLHTTQNSSDNLLCKFIYAATTAAHFGSQIWMTFASGLSLYFSLPRHHFGEVQKVLFPLYFTLTSILSLATLLTHLHLTKSLETTAVLTACFFVELIVRLYLCDPLVRLICVKNEMEAKHGLGMEVGKLAHDSSLFESQEYVTVHKRFRRLHMFIAFSNIACIGFSTAHLYFAVSDLNFKS